MSRRLMPSTPRGAEEGSLPLALLATIVVAGMIGVIMTRMVAGENAVRFDRDFAEALQVADVGINRGLFALNEGQIPPAPGAPSTAQVDGITYEWHGTEIEPRFWQVVSESETAAGVSRRLVAIVEDQPLFFPGAFGDKLVALNGTSTEIDSYNSGSCTTPADACEWGTDPDFGTGNGSLGTNEDFDFSGNTSIRPGGAFLYDWADNPGTGITTDDPFGDRCDGNPCTTEYVTTLPDKLEYASNDRMAFITEKFAAGEACDGASDRQMGEWSLGAKNTTTTIQSYHTATGGTGDPANNDPTDPDFGNFYCADSLDVLGDLELADTVTADNPMVIFVKDHFTIPNPQTYVACHNADATATCPKTEADDASTRSVRPIASRLQIYVAGIPSRGTTAGDISLKASTKFAGVVYAPVSRCGGSGGAEADVYGAIICGTMDNVGNWDFHYDDALGTAGSGVFSVASWQETAPSS
jgi:hypothetical protein